MLRVDDPLPSNAAESGSLVFVLSPERSGSTLLSSMLGAHSRVVAPPELFLLRYVDFDAWRSDKGQAIESLAWLTRRLGEPAEPREIEARFGGLSTADIYRRLLRRVGAGRILVDKTPAYGRDVAILERAEEFAPRYLWLLRHPLGVANSWIERRRSRHWRGAGGAIDAALERWCIVNETVAGFAERIPRERFLKTSYENLVRSPQATLGTISAWLGISFEAAMLEPWKHLPDVLTRGIGDDRIRSHAAIRTDRADSWRDSLDENHLDQRTRVLMEKLGIR